MDLRMLIMASLTSGLAGIGYYIWKKALKPTLQLLYYDIRLLSTLSKVGKERSKNYKVMSLADVFQASVKANPDKVFLIFDQQQYTYSYADKISNKVANLLLSLGIQKGDVVAMVLTNSPQFAWIFLGLTKIGAIPSLLNYNLRSSGLVHNLKISHPKIIIIDSDIDIQNNMKEIQPEFHIPIYVVSTSTKSCILPDFLSFDDVLELSSDAIVDPSLRKPLHMSSLFCYIYTSGTTGVPKACNIYISKFLGSLRFGNIIGICNSDVIYVTLPLYHSNGLFLGFNLALSRGATIVLKKKFSASSFWKDCCQYQVTAVPYIGELCRYVLSQPITTSESLHQVRLMYGNGLSKDIWSKFQNRFHIPRIIEFFGATEGNVLLINTENKVGAVGRISPFLNKILPKTLLVKYHNGTVEPQRDCRGRCIPISPGETGLLLNEIIPRFDNKIYKGTKDLDNQKIVTDVLKKGDKFFNFGDVLFLDEDYFVYFKDRIGDTFRWKGENVATQDITETFRDISFIQDVVVYGVEVTGYEGRAGMASLKLENAAALSKNQLEVLYQHCQKKLPTYSIPLFLRTQKEVYLTGTFKYHKPKLQKEGFNPELISDSLYFLNRSAMCYVPLSNDIYLQILHGLPDM
ncbi:long-chain fatty acid transport protein 6 isoform X2 [Octopus bimaculoides]|uniref:Long-chain-fatty-acid--CoA ligase n=1 Tax=Octopus bimaculoides TaxID=37653 RepID=A0A0L8FQQ3_OCTBM|nr:long-chain fatty acid transport protein 6 isoform X2 [Octopus bimaculoides]XP_052821793.1 long-chain fatty acid transport protein 6 isoform X2 [Octopus bimaculoides]